MKPPFIVDYKRQTGLYYDLAELLSKTSEKYDFITVYVPRRRLDQFIESDTVEGVVLGAHPIWFKDKDQSRHLWLPEFFADADEFISLKSTPFEYAGQASLFNKTIANVAGHYYAGVNEAESSGQLTRINTVGEREVLVLIDKRRVDMGIVSQSTFNYLKRYENLDDIYHMSANQHDSFGRRAFVLKGRTELHQTMNQLFNQILSDGSWQGLVANYQ